MDEAKARTIIDDTLTRLGRLPSEPGEWAAVLVDPTLRERAGYSATPEEDFAGDAVAFIMYGRRLRGGEGSGERRSTITRRVDPLSPPDWWEAESQRRLYALGMDRVWLRLDAGLVDPRAPAKWTGHDFRMPAPHPLGSVAEIAPLVRKLVKRQFERYFALHPSAEGTEGGVLGLSKEHMYEWDELHYPRETWEENEGHGWISFPPTGLAGSQEVYPNLDRVHRRSLFLANELGITQAECLVWGLTDYPLTLPWIELDGRGHYYPDGQWSTVSIQVNSVSTTAQAIARAYTDFRADDWGRAADDGQKTARRAPRPWPALVVGFMQQRQKDAPGETWQKSFEAFKETHPDHPYKTVRTFAEAYRVKARGAKP